MRAIEVMATVDTDGHLVFKEPIRFSASGNVRVIVLSPEEDEVSELEWLHSAGTNEAFDFLNDPEEDIYSLSDGKPFHG